MSVEQAAIKAVRPSGLTIEKNKSLPLFYACLSLLLLFFTAGYILGYFGYFAKKQPVQTRLSPPPPPRAPRVKPNLIPQIQSRPIKTEEKKEPVKIAAEKPAAPAAVEEKTPSFQPFTLRLASYRGKKDALRGMPYFQKKNLNPYLIKIDLEKKGVWWSLYSGHFETEEDAAAAKQRLGGTESIIKEMPYACLIGVYSHLSEIENISKKIETITGFPPYSMTNKDGKIRLFAGSFISRENAEKLGVMLKNNGIQTEVIKR